MPRRDADGWRRIGPLSWKVEREDNHGDLSTTTCVTAIMTPRWTMHFEFTRGWR